MNACYFKPLAILDCSFRQLGRFCFCINTEVITQCNNTELHYAEKNRKTPKIVPKDSTRGINR